MILLEVIDFGMSVCFFIKNDNHKVYILVKPIYNHKNINKKLWR